MRKNLRIHILLVVFTCLFSVCITSLVFVIRYRKYQPLIEASDLIARNSFFYDSKQDGELITGALRGFVYALDDDYSVFFTQQEYEDMLDMQSGNYVGVGILVSEKEDGGFVIDEVFPDSPAEEAGMLTGDQILSVNDISHEGYALWDFLSLIDTQDGATNTLTLLRGTETLTVTVTIREVYRPFVHYQMLDGQVGYIHIGLFQGRCVEETRDALAALEEQGMTKLVLDLRGNLGGSLHAVNDIAEMFLPARSLITTVRGRSGDEVVYKTGYTDGITIPIAMLVDEYSASGSELLAGALKDHGVARLFGRTTYGKGIVQSFFSLSGNRGWLKFTTDAYYTPSGVCIQGTGIEPDEIVNLPDEWTDTSPLLIPRENDTQLQAALAYLKTFG
ncbi:MAG: S41 family peptidase [Clostridiales bacterium]|nr:S41 family peptidase [Clostridiales bacterium]